MRKQALIYMKQHYLFSGLNHEEQAQLLQKSKIIDYQPGSLIFNKGEHAHHFFLIIQGQVRVYFSMPNGREKTIRTFSKSQSFADAVMFMQQDLYPANAITQCESKILCIRIDLFRELLSSKPSLYMSIIHHLIHHVQILNSQLTMLSVMDSKQRLLYYIDQELPIHKENGLTYPLPISKKELSDYLSMRPETLSRNLKQLEQEGVLSWDSKGIHLINWQPITA